MAHKNKTQKIWKRKEDDSLELDIPKVINSDIGFQLMFGMAEDTKEENRLMRKSYDKYLTSVYMEEEIKIWFI
tara:strand:- start:856 stop:1074 length:219 start_codon:yes stop_codon:yes gene_type:complete